MKKSLPPPLGATFRFIILICLSGLVIYACRKIDSRSNGSVEWMEQRFFNSRPSSEPHVRALNDFMKRKNNRDHFVKSTVKQIGYPYWDKSISVKGIADQRGAGGGDTTIITYIPFVRDEENFVNTLLVIKSEAGRDTTFNYLCDWQYSKLYNSSSSPTDSAEQLALFFMMADNEVFGYKDFIITDSVLFRYNDSLVSDVHIETVAEDGRYYNGKANVMSSGPVCIDFYMNLNGCVSCGNTTFQQCWNAYYGVTVGLPPGSGGGDGGGGGSGSPPPCTGPNCGVGWVPVPITEPGNNPPNDSTIAENLKKLYLKGQTKTDSLFTKAMSDGLERTFTFVRSNNDTIPMFFKSGDSLSSSPTFAYDFFSVWHSHQDEGPGDRNQCFDGPDIYKIYKNVIVDNLPIEVVLVTTKDYIYAAVITDTTKFKNYIKAICHNPKDIKALAELLNDLHIDAWDNCNCSWQQGSEAGTLAVTANNNAAISGIKIFKSLRQPINFTPLTP